MSDIDATLEALGKVDVAAGPPHVHRLTRANGVRVLEPHVPGWDAWFTCGRTSPVVPCEALTLAGRACPDTAFVAIEAVNERGSSRTIPLCGRHFTAHRRGNLVRIQKRIDKLRAAALI